MHGRDVDEVHALGVLDEMLDGRDCEDESSFGTEVQLLSAILYANVRVSSPAGTTRECTVIQLLQKNALQDELAMYGLRLVETRRDRRQLVFLADQVIVQKLLKGTKWCEHRIDQLLRRIRGAVRTQQRLYHDHRVWGIGLPWPDCLQLLNGCGPAEAQDAANGA
jgi:hypothetical protein